MITKNYFGTTKDGTDVDVYSIKNNAGTTVDIITYGATINNIYTADRDGKFADILIGFDTVEGHEKYSDNQGMTIGRYANRIANGKLVIDGKEYELNKNEKGVTSLHSDAETSNKVWKAIITDDSRLEMTLSTPDGISGFPGKADYKVIFTLYEDNSLRIDYNAVSDKKTVFNITNHAYFNLSGKGNILNHELTINASAYTPTDEFSIPTGEIRPVEGTAFDFRSPRVIGKDIHSDDNQLTMCKGYDHNFCLDETDGPIAAAYDPETGRFLEVFTDLPGVQLYCANFLDGTKPGKNGIMMEQHAGFCLETQYYPNTPNTPSFPQCTFNAGEKYESSTVFRFSVK